MPAIFEYVHTVIAEEIDPLGHANNIAYLGWMQAAAIEHSTLQGWSTAAYREQGWAWLVRSHSIEYRRPALLGDVIRVRTWVCDMQRFTSRRKFEMFRDTALIARAETNWAFVDTRAGKLRPIAAEVAAAFEIVPATKPTSTTDAAPSE